MGIERLAKECAVEMDGDPIRAKVIQKYLSEAEARGRRQGLEEAARMAENLPGEQGRRIAIAIRALISEDGK